MELEVVPDSGNVYQSDGELVGRARAGDGRAFDELFQRHYARTVNVAFRLHGNMDDAQDIAQTAFVRLHNNLGRVRDGQALQAWLYRTVVNLVRDRQKSTSRKPWLRFSDLVRSDGDTTHDEEGWAVDADADPARLVEGKQLGAALEEAVADLPLEFREVVVLHHLEQMDVDAIARLLGVPVGTVKSRLARGRERMRRQLMPWFVDEGASR